MNVAVVDIQFEAARRVASELGDQALAVRADVADEDSVAATVDTIRSQWGRIDILVNNAGIGQTFCHLTEMLTAEWNKVLAVNLTGVFFMCRAIVPHMVAAGFGRIINIASAAALRPPDHVVAYNVSKAGVVSLTQTLAREVGSRGITVNAVCPGNANTELGQRALRERGKLLGISTEAFRERYISRLAIPRLAEPDDVAHAVAFLATDGAGYITGETLAVCGGF
jgi:3-oxoacyl-[acyl-carrier protein] reductase